MQKVLSVRILEKEAEFMNEAITDLFPSIWMLSVLFSYWLAKSKGRSGKKWIIIAVLFGPLTLVALLVLPRTDSASGVSSFKGQIYESIRSFQYLILRILERFGVDTKK